MINKNTENMSQIKSNQSLIDFTEDLTDKYIEKTSSQYRKKKGQYFTPKTISEFMIKQFNGINKKGEIRILDPGAGIGVFESAFCEYMKSQEKNIRAFFDLYENDDLLIPFLNLNMKLCQENMAENGFEISYKIFDEDFVLSNSPIFNDKLDEFNLRKDGYDFVIANPPYYKLRKESPHAVVMKSIIRGQINIYALFIALSGKLLKYGGQITVLTPRSYFSGLYFEKFRKWFFKRLKPTRIHIFESRKVFKKYNVRQEMVILTAINSSKNPKNVIISTSSNEPDLKGSLKVRKTSYEKIAIENNGKIFIRVPKSKLDEQIAEYLDKLGFKLDTLGLKASTGPVVPFRVKNYLLSEINNPDNSFPLVWMQNLREGKVKWPIQLSKKPIAIENKDGSNKLLVSSGNYVLIKRFSTKEGKRRINAYVVLDKFLNSDYIGIENHVNYIYRIKGKLTENEAYGIAALLNSTLYNRYFQITNGSTQVNASEINNIPLPSLEKIRLIGNLIKEKNENDEIEKIILGELNIDDNALLFELIG
jgi:adenine-specific DNA-methyltransferase